MWGCLMALSLDYRIQIPLHLVRIQIASLRKFYDQGEKHFNSGFDELKARIDQLTPEEWSEGEDYYLEQRDELESLRHLNTQFAIVGLFTVFETFLRWTLHQLLWVGAVVPARRSNERWNLDKMNAILKTIGVPITKPDADWNSIKKLQVIRNCITHLDGRPDEETVRRLQAYNCQVIKGVRMKLPDRYFAQNANLVERICERIVKDCQNAAKEKRILA